MEKNMYSRPLSLRSMKINDKFWKQEMEAGRIAVPNPLAARLMAVLASSHS